MSVIYEIKNFTKHPEKKSYKSYVLGGDIGGTNTTFGLAGVTKTKVSPLISLRFHTKQLSSLLPALQETLEFIKTKYDITPSATCIGAAGVISPEKTKATLPNIPWDIDLNILQQHTSLENITLINDFQATGYGISLLNTDNETDFYPVTKDITSPDGYPPKAAIGAGTGLGKTLLLFNKHTKTYVPHPSEGGHSDIPVYDMNELGLLRYIQRTRKITYPIYYDEILSGRGITNIYQYLRNQKNITPSRYTAEIDCASDLTPLIAKYRTKDHTCSETFHLFTRIFARCAKNFVLDTLAIGGLYIAGGIAAKNPDLFTTSVFLDEFYNSPYQMPVLKQIPITVVTNTDVGLIGAFAAAHFFHRK